MNQTAVRTGANRLATIDPKTMDALAACSQQATNAFAVATTDTVNVAAALAVADSIQDLRALFDRLEVRQRIEALQDTPLGFRTDRDPKQKNRKTGQSNEPYDWVIVRDASIESALRGLQLVGNQWNIISNRFYCTKEGFEFLIRKVPGLTEFRPVVGVPKTLGGGALVECRATWKLNGSPAGLEVVIPVKTDDYSGADQIIGKATRKFLKRCYEMMCGASVPEGEAGEAGVIEIEAPPASTAQRLVGRSPEPEPESPPPAPRPATPAPPPRRPATQGSLLAEPPDQYALLELAINRQGTLADFVEALIEDQQIGTLPPESVRTINDIPLEIVKRYAGRAGDYAPVKESMEFIISKRKGAQ